MTSSDDPIRLAETWLAECDIAFDEVQPLAGDVSTRRYVRVALSTGGSAVLALYPPAMVEAGDRFLRTAELLAAAGVRTPEIVRWDAPRGIMWLEDVGDRSLYALARHGGGVADSLQRAVDIAGRLAGLDPAGVGAVNPPLDAALLRGEVDQSWRLVLGPRGLTGEGAASEDLRRCLGALCDRLAAAPGRPCHRDFMARNLMLTTDGELVVLDHQDLRLGPPWYDLACLLNDSLYATATEEVDWLDRARVPRPERENYHRAAGQRALKIVGTFAAFAQRGATRHLPLVVPSLRAARRHLLRLPETAPVLRRLAEAWDRATGDDAESGSSVLC